MLQSEIEALRTTVQELRTENAALQVGEQRALHDVHYKWTASSLLYVLLPPALLSASAPNRLAKWVGLALYDAFV